MTESHTEDIAAIVGVLFFKITRGGHKRTQNHIPTLMDENEKSVPE